jgi:aerotaxis receptor
MASRPRPTAVEHPVHLDELFFSTTDRRGVIRSGNSVFVRISRYGLDELVGSPHNINRHPDMPAGAFHLMWSRLLAGEPMGAYVQNMAADGGTYWVFATVTPLGDGFLSVRSAPCGDAFPIVREVYRGARAEEERFAASGHHRAEVARHGARYLEQAVDALGFESYEAFMFEALVAEQGSRRGRLGARAWSRPGASGPAADVLATVAELDATLSALGDRVDVYRHLAARVAPASTGLLSSATALEHAADHAVQASEASDKKVLSNVSRVMRSPMREAIGALTALAPTLGHVQRTTREVAFLVALAQLHAEMIVRFAIEVIDGEAPDGSATEIGQLCDALHEDVTAMVAGVDGLTTMLHDVGTSLEQAAASYDTFGKFLAEWTRLAVRNLTGTPLGTVLGPIESEFAHGRERLHTLHDLASDSRDAAVPLDVARFDALLDRMRRDASAYSPDHLPPPVGAASSVHHAA